MHILVYIYKYIFTYLYIVYIYKYIFTYLYIYIYKYLSIYPIYLWCQQFVFIPKYRVRCNLQVLGWAHARVGLGVSLEEGRGQPHGLGLGRPSEWWTLRWLGISQPYSATPVASGSSCRFTFLPVWSVFFKQPSELHPWRKKNTCVTWCLRLFLQLWSCVHICACSVHVANALESVKASSLQGICSMKARVWDRWFASGWTGRFPYTYIYIISIFCFSLHAFCMFFCNHTFSLQLHGLGTEPCKPACAFYILSREALTLSLYSMHVMSIHAKECVSRRVYNLDAMQGARCSQASFLSKPQRRQTTAWNMIYLSYVFTVYTRYMWICFRIYIYIYIYEYISSWKIR